jgi:hypothetical protein
VCSLSASFPCARASCRQIYLAAWMNGLTLAVGMCCLTGMKDQHLLAAAGAGAVAALSVGLCRFCYPLTFSARICRNTATVLARALFGVAELRRFGEQVCCFG